jgi:hypothetical protein
VDWRGDDIECCTARNVAIALLCAAVLHTACGTAIVDSDLVDSDGDGPEDSLDCAPTDPSRWQLLVYAYRDVDLDGYGVDEQGTRCSGESLPPPTL